MKELFILLSIILVSSCSYHRPLTWQEVAKTEMLKVCWDNENALVEEACAEPEYIEWDHTPVIVTTDLSMEYWVKKSIEAWNDVLGFEMFKYSRLDVEADVAFMRGGDHFLYRGMAMFFKHEGKMKAGVFMYDSALNSIDTYMHELGHVMGLRHDEEDTRSIMYPNNSRYLPQIQRRDRAMIVLRYAPQKRYFPSIY